MSGASCSTATPSRPRRGPLEGRDPGTSRHGAGVDWRLQSVLWWWVRLSPLRAALSSSVMTEIYMVGDHTHDAEDLCQCVCDSV